MRKIKIIYPNLRGVDGGVHGELPSLYEPPNEAPCRLRTAFNKLIVELLKPYLNDCLRRKGNKRKFLKELC